MFLKTSVRRSMLVLFTDAWWGCGPEPQCPPPLRKKGLTPSALKIRVWFAMLHQRSITRIPNVVNLTQHLSKHLTTTFKDIGSSNGFSNLLLADQPYNKRVNECSLPPKLLPRPTDVHCRPSHHRAYRASMQTIASKLAYC